MTAEAITRERSAATREVEFLDDQVFDFLETAWTGSTPRLMFGSWLKTSFAVQEQMGGAKWVKQYQLYKPETVTLSDGSTTVGRRFVILTMDPQYLTVAKDVTPDADRRFREHSRVYYCYLRLNEAGKIADFLKTN